MLLTIIPRLFSFTTRYVEWYLGIHNKSDNYIWNEKCSVLLFLQEYMCTGDCFAIMVEHVRVNYHFSFRRPSVILDS